MTQEDKTLSQVIAELEENLNNGTYLTFIPSDFMQIIRTLEKDKELLRKALQYVRHRDARWHGDDVVTPALSFTDPNQPWKG